MEQSPLTQQPRPEAFQPKIVQLYDELLEDHHDLSEGFWAEFFLLRPDRRALRQRIDALSAGDLLALEAQTRQLFARAVAVLVAGAGVPTSNGGPGHRRNGSATNSAAGSRLASPISRAVSSFPSPAAAASASDHAVEAALATLTTFLSAALAKKYTNPSSDAIALLAGLDKVDAVLADFVGALDHLLRHGRSPHVRARAVSCALAVTAGAYQTTLLTYFIQRDLFPAIIRALVDVPSLTTPAFTLIGLLANYNKFEFQNPYQLRLNDFVNEAAIQTVLWSVGDACRRLRGQYLAVQDDLPEGWTLASTLGLIGLGAIAPGGQKVPAKPVYDVETAKQLFAELPGDEAAVLLATYDFTHANKLFCFNLVTLGPQPVAAAKAAEATTPNSATATSSSTSSPESPFASFLSLTSYLLQNAYRAPRTTLYTHLSLMVVRLLIEDPALCKRMCSNEDDAVVAVRLCRQRPPHLPLLTGKQARRPLAAAVLDAMVDGVTHNLRRRLDVGLYTLCVGILLRLVSYLARTRTRLAYGHWADLFRALLGLIRFLTTYAADLQGQGTAAGSMTSSQPHLETLLDHVVNLIALGLSAGEAFLPTPAAYDDLFYKVVEAGDVLEKFRDTYGLASRPTNGIDTLLSVSAHYKQMLADGVLAKGGKRVKAPSGGGGGSSSSALTSLQVAEVIKQGYETLSIQARDGLDGWEKYREADERTLLKKVARAAVADVRRAVEQEEER